MKPYFSKSSYALGLKCLRHLWLAFNEPDKIPKIDEAGQHRMDEGIAVGKLAQQLFSNGINAQTGSFEDGIKDTKVLLKQRKILYEAAITAGWLYARADVLVPANKDEWDVYEVKSSTKVKEEYLHDVSFQKYCYTNAGLKIRKCFVVYINNKYIKNGEINLKELFAIEDVTEKANKIGEGIEQRIALMKEIVHRKTCPTVKEDKCCPAGPKNCEVDCWHFLPDNNVFHLHRIGEKAFELFESGVVNINDIPENYELTEHQDIQRKCEETGRPHINKKEIGKFLNSLKYPLYFLDFETYGTAIPLYDGLKPYQNLPFQFSLHVIEKEGEKPKHYSFLAEGSADPRKKFAEELKKVLGDRGSIIVYFQGFESGRLKELAEHQPEYKKWADSVSKRIIDLYEPFKNFYYYNPGQCGSASIKAVLPALTGKSYDTLEIREGQTASLQYLYIAHGKPTPEETKKIRRGLEIYCGQDTEGMVWILEELKKLTS